MRRKVINRTRNQREWQEREDRKRQKIERRLERRTAERERKMAYA